MLGQDTAGEAFRRAVLDHDAIDTSPAASWAQSTDPVPEQRQRGPPPLPRDRLVVRVKRADEVGLPDRGDEMGGHPKPDASAPATALQIIGAPYRWPRLPHGSGDAVSPSWSNEARKNAVFALL